MRDRRASPPFGTGEKAVSRRAFIGRAASAMGAFLASFIAVPIVGSFVSPALKKSTPGHWKNLGSVTKFRVGTPKSERVSLIKKDGWVTDVATRLIWVVRLGENDFAVYNAQCTHLGCLVDWAESGMAGKLGWNFYSPCHGGVFKMDDGSVLAGPPPRPLDVLDHKVEKGELWVNYQDFRLGIPEKVPI
ncbi:MAG: ubiquinol-cytochrome c reductase iron-sulfur subunit [Dehalococcoidia bacterium]|nr:ubiquinol-cytochrome c reductase iron-sulfur subunit [Dehalococcoidia bacterium]